MGKCQSCGAPLTEGANFCSACGASIRTNESSNEVMSNLNYWSLVALVLAAILALLCLITAVADTSSFINRMYTTAVEWNIPLVCIALIAIGFVTTCKARGSHLFNYIAVGLLIVAFGFSNINKNKLQDYISNADNVVSVVAEGVSDNASSIGDWLDLAEDAAKDLDEEYDDYREAKRRAERKKYGYDEYGYDDYCY